MSQTNLADQALKVRKMITTGQAHRLRVAAGLSLERSGRTIGVSSATVYRWERDERKPQGRNMAAYHDFLMSLDAFDVPADDTEVNDTDSDDTEVDDTTQETS